VNLYPMTLAPLIPLYPYSPVGENRSRQNLTCSESEPSVSAAAAAAAPLTTHRAATVRPATHLPSSACNRHAQTEHLDSIHQLPETPALRTAAGSAFSTKSAGFGPDGP
jgi:hypothetical protein